MHSPIHTEHTEHTDRANQPPHSRPALDPPREETRLSRALTGLVGTYAEAWTELRTHKLRVVLSLVGIAIAVAALTGVVALGELAKQSMLEDQERWGGRIATIRVDAHSLTEVPVDWDELDTAFATANARYGFDHTARLIHEQVMLPVQLPDGVKDVPSRQFDPSYPIIHRAKLQEGRWFDPTDAELLAPPVVVSGYLWELLGSPALSSNPTLTMTGTFSGVYPIIGVTPKDGPWDTTPRVDMLFESYVDRTGPIPGTVNVSREIWLNGNNAAEIGPVLAMDLRSAMPQGVELQVSRTDSGASPDFEQSILLMQLLTSGVAGIVLLLGGLSLVNIQLVAMKQRIREIGVRRSFGASGARIFSSVMMESVVATTVAGVLGIVLAVAVVRSPILLENLFYGMQDTPTFPYLATLVGLVAAVITGALAGLVPAIVATRVRVIEAIRF